MLFVSYHYKGIVVEETPGFPDKHFPREGFGNCQFTGYTEEDVFRGLESGDLIEQVELSALENHKLATVKCTILYFRRV